MKQVTVNDPQALQICNVIIFFMINFSVNNSTENNFYGQLQYRSQKVDVCSKQLFYQKNYTDKQKFVTQKLRI